MGLAPDNVEAHFIVAACEVGTTYKYTIYHD